MLYQISHRTRYTYHDSVSICHNLAWLIPRNTSNQECQKIQIEIKPNPSLINQYQDYFGNEVLYFAIQEDHAQLDVTIHSTIKLVPPQRAAQELYAQMPWEEAIEHLHAEHHATHLDARQFTHPTGITPSLPAIEAFARQSFTPGRPVLEALQHLNSRIFHEFKFEPGFTTISTPVEVVLAERKGVCQDFAHLALACLRSIGIPARYVSGYIETLPPPGKEKLQGVDASHAWFSAYVPYVGWLDFDPTNNVEPTTQHITIGWGRHYADVPPMKGVILSSGAHSLKVSVDVKRISDAGILSRGGEAKPILSEGTTRP